MKGVLISFEGTDGCGKSTQIRLLKDYLEKKGLNVTVSREPGGCRVAEKIRDILLNADNAEISSMCELFLYEAARAQHMAEIVVPALNAGNIVILDRFIDSTLAYQGFGRELGVDAVEYFNSAAIGNRFPNATLMLKLSPELAFKRKGGNDIKDRMEMAGNKFFDRVNKGFEYISENYPDRITVVSVDGTKEETHKKICKFVDNLLENCHE